MLDYLADNVENDHNTQNCSEFKSCYTYDIKCNSLSNLAL